MRRMRFRSSVFVVIGHEFKDLLCERQVWDRLQFAQVIWLYRSTSYQR